MSLNKPKTKNRKLEPEETSLIAKQLTRLQTEREYYEAYLIPQHELNVSASQAIYTKQLEDMTAKLAQTRRDHQHILDTIKELKRQLEEGVTPKK